MPYANTHNAKAMPIIASVGDSGANLYNYEDQLISSQSSWEPCSSGTGYIKNSSTYSRLWLEEFRQSHLFVHLKYYLFAL